jgi:hypothetical protein
MTYFEEEIDFLDSIITEDEIQKDMLKLELYKRCEI